MSFAGLQDRLTALQESTGQLRELVDRLASLTFQPGSVPLGTDEEDSVSGELSAEIGQILKANAEDQELLLEEANYLRPEGHEKERLVEGVVRVGGELTKYVFGRSTVPGCGGKMSSSSLTMLLDTAWLFEKLGYRPRRASSKHKNSSDNSFSNHIPPPSPNSTHRSTKTNLLLPLPPRPLSNCTTAASTRAGPA